jgi:hypothetical protein
MALTQAAAMPGRASDRDLITPSPFAGPVISLDPISVRIGDEGGVVIGPIHRPQTGRAVVMPAGAQRRCVKRIDGENPRDGSGIGIGLLGSVGPVVDVYPEGRDRSLPNPSVGVSAKTIGGMSGGAAFDAQGRLIGIITSGVGEEISFITLSWPIVFTPIEIAWPPGLIQGPTTLHAMATEQRLCRIENIEALRSHLSEGGEPFVGLSSMTTA